MHEWGALCFFALSAVLSAPELAGRSVQYISEQSFRSNHDSSGIVAQNLPRVSKQLRQDVQVKVKLCQHRFLVVFRSIDTVPHAFDKKLALIG